MATITATPETIDFCFNKPMFRAEAGVQLTKFAARVFIEENYGSNTFTELPYIYLDTDEYSAELYVGEILKNYFDTIKTDIFPLSGLAQDTYVLKRYYVEFYEMDEFSLGEREDVPIPPPSGDVTSPTRYIVYGRLPYQEWPDHDFFGDLATNLDYLTNVDTEINTWQAAKHYFSWVNHVIGTNSIQLRATIYYTDKTSETQTVNTYTDSDRFDVLIFPAGFDQLSLGTYTPAKTAYRYDIGLYLADDTQVGKTLSFYIKNKPWWGKQFVFRNNFGALETIIAEGKEESEVMAEIETSKKRTQYDYSSRDFEYVQRVKSRTKEFKCSLGPFTQTEAEHLEEMLNDKLFKIGDTDFIPCIILNKSIKPYSENEDLQVIELNYQYAFDI